MKNRYLMAGVVLLLGLSAWFVQAGLTTVSPSRTPKPSKRAARTVQEPVSVNIAAFAASRRTMTTPNTVRLHGENIYAAATAVTQVTYGATHHEDRPHAVALVRADRQADAMLAAARITHFPSNAPVLYVDEKRLPPETAAELNRLHPDGNTYDNDVQVYLVGPISKEVEREVKRMGFNTRAFRIENPVLLAEVLDRWAAAVHADHPDQVTLVQFNALDTGLPAVAWNAHMGHALLFVTGEVVPQPTRRALTRRFQREAFLYLMGDSMVISENVARELADFGHVQRVRGRTPSEISVRFAQYRDHGLNQGYWLGQSSRDFGWAVTEAGHNFTFVSPDDWQLAVTGSLLSHLGKHGPLILLTNGRLDDGTKAFLQRVKPFPGAVNNQLCSHGWVLGDTASISWETQADLDLLLDAELKLEVAAAADER